MIHCPLWMINLMKEISFIPVMVVRLVDTGRIIGRGDAVRRGPRLCDSRIGASRRQTNHCQWNRWWPGWRMIMSSKTVCWFQMGGFLLTDTVPIRPSLHAPKMWPISSISSSLQGPGTSVTYDEISSRLIKPGTGHIWSLAYLSKIYYLKNVVSLPKL